VSTTSVYYPVSDTYGYRDKLPQGDNSTESTLKFGDDAFSRKATAYIAWNLDDVPRGSTIHSAKITLTWKKLAFANFVLRMALLNDASGWGRTTDWDQVSSGTQSRSSAWGATAAVATSWIEPPAPTLYYYTMDPAEGDVAPMFGLAHNGVEDVNRFQARMRRIGSLASNPSLTIDAYRTTGGPYYWRRGDLIQTSDAVLFNDLPTAQDVPVVFNFSRNIRNSANEVIIYQLSDATWPDATNTIELQMVQAQGGSSFGMKGSTNGFGRHAIFSDYSLPQPTVNDTNATFSAPNHLAALLYGPYTMPVLRLVDDTVSFGDASTSPDYTAANLGQVIDAIINDGGVNLPNYDIIGDGTDRRFAIAFDPTKVDNTIEEIEALGASLEITYTKPIAPPPATVPTTAADEFSASETSIANGALVLLGEQRIDSLNDSKKTARLIADRFCDLRDELLRVIPWSFAVTRAEISSSATKPAWQYGYMYPLPKDCLRVVDVENEYALSWIIEGRAIITNIFPPLKIEYIRRVESPMDMTVDFRQTLSALIAVDLAEAVTGSSEKLREVFGILRSRSEAAATANGQEQQPREVRPFSAWLSTRGRARERD